MAEQTSVKFFTYDMLRMPSVVPNNLSSIRDLLRFCLVNGSPEVAVTSATVTAGVCRMTVAAGNTFSFQSVVLCSGFNQAGANGEHRVWVRCEVEDFEHYNRPESQGGMWVLAQKMKILEVLS